MNAFVKILIWIAGVLFFGLTIMAHSFHVRATPPHGVAGIDKILINYFYLFESIIFIAVVLIFRKSERIVLSWIMVQNFICLYILITGIMFHVFAVSHPSMQK